MRRTIIRLAPLSSPHSIATGPYQLPPISVSKLLSPVSDSGEDVEPGQHVLSVCRRHNIAFPSQLKAHKGVELGTNPYKMGVSLSHQHCFEVKSMKYFDQFEHPFAKSLLEIYVEKTKQPLWISCFAYGASPFPNKKASKKVSHALRDALAAAGYDSAGRRVSIDGESSVIADLYGTLRVMIANPQAVCNAKFVDILENAKAVVASAELQLRRDKNGQHLAKQQHHPPRRDGQKFQKRHNKMGEAKGWPTRSVEQRTGGINRHRPLA